MSDDFDERRFSPDRTILLTLPVANEDGTMDMQTNVPAAFGSTEDAEADAIRDVKKYGGFVVIYECRPVRWVRKVGRQAQVMHDASELPVG